MLENLESDIYGEIAYAPITLFGNKLNVGVIGGGKGAFIKTKSFYNKGSSIEILSLNFIDEFNKLKSENVKFIKAAYYKEFINDKHIIIIAIDDKKVISQIKADCEELHKIYINSSQFKAGMGVIPVSRESNNITVAINTKVGNPRGSIMVADAIKEVIDEYDYYVYFTGKIRNNSTLDKNTKDELIKFINCKDSKYFYDKGKFIQVLQLFYDEDILRCIRKLEKEE